MSLKEFVLDRERRMARKEEREEKTLSLHIILLPK
jgi:hypothetical protein